MKVYRHISTGDLYALERGDLGRIVGLDYGRRFVLAPLIRYQIKGPEGMSPIVPAPRGNYDILMDDFSHELCVTEAELAVHFEIMKDWYAVQNTDIHELKAQYERECVSFSDSVINQTAEHVLRTCENVKDSKFRCDAHQLATFVLKRHG